MNPKLNLEACGNTAKNIVLFPFRPITAFLRWYEEEKRTRPSVKPITTESTMDCDTSVLLGEAYDLFYQILEEHDDQDNHYGINPDIAENVVDMLRSLEDWSGHAE